MRSRAPHPPLSLRPALALALLPTLAAAGDWPCWRGPDGDNVSKERGWSSHGAVAWRAQVGTGYSTPVVAGGRVFVTGFLEDEATPGEGVDRVSCLELETGALVWSVEYPALAYANEHRGGALSTATWFEGALYVPTRKGELRAFDAGTGELRWLVDLVERHQVDPGRYGFASSPRVLGPDLVLNAGATLRIDRDTGDTIWVSEFLDASYSTVAPLQLEERACLAAFGGRGLALLDAESGETVSLWPFRTTPRNVEGATPIVLGTRVFLSSAYDQGAALVDFASGEPVELWRSRRMRNKMAGCTLYEGHLYGFDESILKCIDLEGNERWRKRGLGQGALMAADGRLLFTSSDGELVVARATPEDYVELARQKLIDGGVFWATPVLSEGRVLVRGSAGELVCTDHRGEALAAGEARPAAAELPSAESLLARHVEALGFGDAAPEGLHFAGTLTISAVGFAGSSADWSIDAQGRWYVRFDLPPFMPGSVERVFDGRHAWERNPYRGDKLLEERALAELRATAGCALLLRPWTPAAEARTVALEPFRGAPCHRVDVALEGGRTRSLYFDAATGLLAGRTSPDETTVVLSDWREHEGRRLPFARTEFDPESGEERRWRFDSVAFEPIDAAHFTPPEGLREALEALRRAEDEERRQPAK